MIDKKRVCTYCKGALPDGAEMNPTWPWAAMHGRQKMIMCGDNCMKWFQYRNAQKKLIGVMKNKHFSEEEIADRMLRMKREWEAKGQYPAKPDPVLRHDKEVASVVTSSKDESCGIATATFDTKRVAVNIDKLERKMEEVRGMQNVETPETVPEAVRNVIDEYMENKPTEAVEAVTEAPVKPEAVFDELADIVNSGFKVEPKKSLLTMRIREMTLEGQFVRASVLYEHGQTFVDMEAISAPMGDDLADELQELVDEIKEAMKA